MKRLTSVLWLVGLLNLSLFVLQSRCPLAASEPQPAGMPRPGWTKPSKSPQLTLVAEKRNVPAIRRPKPRVLTPEEKATLPPPDWVVVYTPATGQIRYEPPRAEIDLRLRPASNSTPSSLGLLGRVPGVLNIIGTDERQRVTPTTDFPWRVIGKTFIRFPNNSTWGGSGALIDSFHVLTAGHVVYDSAEGGWATQIEFVPGLDGDAAPFSSAWDVELRAPSGWISSEDAEYDWGLITLDRNVGSVIGWLGYAYEPLDYYPGRTFNLAGYPAELAQGNGLYWAANVATRATDNLLYHVIDSTGGQSGGPIWRYVQATDQSHIMAVHAGGGDTENSGTRINASRYDAIGTWAAEDTTPTDYADLIDDGVSYAGFNPTNVSAGTPFEVYCDVRNIGTAIATNFDVTFYASADTSITQADHMIGAVHVSSLESFHYVTCRWTGSFPSGIPAGNYVVGWLIDPNNTVDEISETNNLAYLSTPLVVTVVTPPNLTFTTGDFSPAAPVSVAPGSLIQLSTHVYNAGGSNANSFWLEFWGSRTGGLTRKVFVADSTRLGPFPPTIGQTFSAAVPLNSVPDGPYTVVMLADRLNEVIESNELDNRWVIGGKRLLVIRPQTNADIAVSGFSFGPNPAFSGQTITLGGTVQNVGADNTGAFWIEFFGSYDRLYPSTDFFLCDSIEVSNLAPGQAINLSQYSRTLYNTPSGTFMVGVFADRPDQVSERDETNNYQFLDGYRLNQTSPAPAVRATDAAKLQLPDLVVATADFSPYSPYQAPPGTIMTISTRVENRSSYAAGPFWLEIWGSRTGGLTLDEFLAESVAVSGLQPWDGLTLTLYRPVYSIPDGPYSVVITADRPGQVSEGNEGNNRRAVAGKRLLTIRPQTQANLVLEAVSVGPNPLHRSAAMTLSGQIRNSGTSNTGAFWIEFFGTTRPYDPDFDFFLCDSILVSDLAPGQAVNLSAYSRTLYSSVPLGSMAVICFADRTDVVNETQEADNYVILSGYSVSP